MVNKSMPDHIREIVQNACVMTFSPSGIFEMDDGENWENATQANEGVVTRKQSLHYGLRSGTSRRDDPELPGNISKPMYSDVNQLVLGPLVTKFSWC